MNRYRYLITEALLKVAQAARPVADGDTTGLPKLIRALDELDQARAAAASELGTPMPAIIANQAEILTDSKAVA